MKRTPKIWNVKKRRGQSYQKMGKVCLLATKEAAKECKRFVMNANLGKYNKNECKIANAHMNANLGKYQKTM